MIHLRKTLLVFAVLTGTLAESHAQMTLLAGWDFQTTANGGTAASAAPNSPLVYAANFGVEAGSSTIYLNGTHSSGSSTGVSFTSTASNPQVTSSTGTTVNAGPGFSTIASGAASLEVANSSANGYSLSFTLSMTGYTDLTVSYATRGNGTGFMGNQWSYSTDGGTTFTNFGSTINPVLGYRLVTLPDLTAVDNDSSVILRYTLAGAAGATGSNSLDNIQLNAEPMSAVPEPSTYALIFGGAALGVAMWRRRQQSALA